MTIKSKKQENYKIQKWNGGALQQFFKNVEWAQLRANYNFYLKLQDEI